MGSSQKLPVPSNKLAPGSAKVFLSSTINIYASRTLCDWELISGTGAFNRSTLERRMPHVHNGSTVRMERPKLAKAEDGSGCKLSHKPVVPPCWLAPPPPNSVSQHHPTPARPPMSAPPARPGAHFGGHACPRVPLSAT